MQIGDVTQLGYVAFITFGLVWFISILYPLDSKQKFIGSVVIAVLVSFVPANLGNEIMNRIKDGFGIATALAGIYQFSAKVFDRAS